MAHPPKNSRFSVVAIFLTLLGLSGLPAQAATDPAVVVPARVTHLIQEQNLVALKGNTHPLTKKATDLGMAPAKMPANRMILVLKHSAEQEAALQTFLQAVHNPSAQEYRHWLTPEEYGTRFGVADSDLLTVQNWLQSHGFTVNRVAKSKLSIEFSGTVGQLQSAFHTEIHSYMVNGEKHLANASDPKIPAALTPVVAGLAQMSDFYPKSHAIRGPGGRYNSATGRIEPEYTNGDLTKGYTLFVGPADAATIYDTPNSLNPNASGTKYDGTGVTIGIAGDSNINTQQNDNYRATFGLPAKATTVVVDGSFDPGVNGDAIEAYLDTEVAGGLAPNANIVLYTAANTNLTAGLFLGIWRAIDDNQADILNVSFGGCEANQGAAGNQYIYQTWEQAAAQGITVTVSSGDSGAAGCDNPNTEAQAVSGLAVNGLGSTPFNIIVGGTDYDALYSSFPGSFTQYVDISNTLANHRSAKSYIPEEPWNNSTFFGFNTTIAQNVTWASQGSANAPNQNIVGGGGGTSTVYATPTWQSSFAKDNSGRNVPDVSFLAANNLYGAIWGLCTDQDSVADCVGNPTTGNSFALTGVGGTSASAPAFAGMLALVAQKQGGRLGQADYVLYDLAKTKYSTVFHDITVGNNSVYCVSGSTNCTTNTAGYPFLTGFDTATGYDEATGLGSVDISKLVSNWASAGLSTTTTQLKLNGGTSAISITHGASVSVGVTVASTGGTPDGDVAIVDNLNPATFPNNSGIAGFTLSSGTVSGTTTFLPGGTYKVSAHYGGSSTFAESDSTGVSVTVAAESSSTKIFVPQCYDPTTFTLVSTVYYGEYCFIDGQPYGNSASATAPNGYAIGSVSFLTGSTSLGSAVIGSDGVAELQTESLPGGTDSLTASFAGDASFAASTSAPLSFTVLPALTTATVSANTASITAGSSVTLTAALTNINSVGAAPTGTVTFTSGTTTLGSVPLVGTPGTNTAYAGGQAQYTTTLLPAGSDSITVSYGGDSNYAASGTSFPQIVTVAAATSAMTVTPSATSISVGQSMTVTVGLTTVTGLGAPTGTVTLSGGGYTSAAQTLNSSGAYTFTIPAHSLTGGSDTLTVSYAGDAWYASATGTTTVTVSTAGTLTPTVAVTPAVTRVSSFPLAVAVAVSGTGATPTGTVVLSSGSFTSSPATLTGGAATISVTSGNLAAGTDTLTVTYSGDTNYKSGTGTSSVFVLGNPALTVTPSSASVTTGSPLTITVTVPTVAPLAAPTGTVTVSFSGHTTSAVAVSSNTASVSIDTTLLAVGADSLTANYSGDTNYNPATGTTTVTASAPVPGFTISGTAVSISAPGTTTGNVSTLTVTPTNGFTGTVTLTGAITSSPAGAVDPPTITITGSPVNVTGIGPQAATLTVNTTAPTTAAVTPAKAPWLPAGGMVLAGLLLLGIPARKRAWRGVLSLMVLLAAIATGVTACGGSSSHNNGNPGTTVGTYTITVTATAGATTSTGTITVIVN